MAPNPKIERLLDFLADKRKEAAVFAALALTLALPFCLRPSDRAYKGEIDAQIVIITPHNESIRAEFSQAFAHHMKETTGKNIHIDWRTPGGTSEISRVLASEFSAAIENHRKQNPDLPWDDIAAAFHDWKNDVPPDAAEIASLPQAERARILADQIFLNSNIGIGIDLFFGGGAFDFTTQASRDRLVPGDPESGIGIAAIAAKHPTWFSPDVIPAAASGEPYIDPQFRWVGTCLSAFGIVYNRDVLHRLGIAEEPKAWEDLAHHAYFRHIALADPSKSGSVTKAFEMLIQQQMHLALERNTKTFPDADPATREAEAVREGWDNGMRLILKLGANARYFTDTATKIPLDVSRGDAAAGMCIDFYGRTFVDRLAPATPGTLPRVGYITPAGGTSVGADPIALLRGAPNPELATAFIEFVLSPRGQALWGYRKGVPGGPVHTSLHRLPIRKDLYAGEGAALLTNPDVRPYEDAAKFTYRPEWTGKAFNSIRFLVRIMCVDTHHELTEAWESVFLNNFPTLATQTLFDLRIVGYDSATGTIADILSSSDKIRQVTLAKELGDFFRNNYAKADTLARQRR